MKAKYRTIDGEFNVMDKPIIIVEQNEGDGFTMLGYESDFHMQTGTAIEGVGDIMAFEIFGEDA